jgi:hypothetical protein
MVESDVYETKKSFVNVTCSFYKISSRLLICPTIKAPFPSYF